MSGDPFGVIGSVIDGQFRVDSWIGEGGFSVVYKGFHLGLQEPIAIKCLKLPQSLAREVIEQFQNRFRDESRIAYRLSQGNLHIVRSITSGSTTSPSGQVIPYMVLEWLDGITLSQDYKQRRDSHQTGRKLDEIVQMFAPAAEALAYAHAHGVVHRDVKPGNLFLAQTREGYRMKVLDFGMAKILSDGNLGIAPLAQSTGSLVVFSAPYAAPEQFDPKIGSIGTWTDVYSLALVLLEAMRDQRVRNVDSVAECLMQAVDPAQAPTPTRLGLHVSSALDEVFARALAVNPRERAQDVGEFWGQLRNAMLREAEEEAAAQIDSIPPGVDGEGDDPATIVADTTGMFDEANGLHEDEPTRNVDLNSPQFSGGQGLPPEVKDFLSRAQQQTTRSQDAGGQTMAMQPPAAGAPWPPTPLPAAGRPAPQGGFAPGTNASPGGIPLDSSGEPATLAMHSPLANQTFQQQQLNSPQFQNAAALGMTMPLMNNGPPQFPGLPPGAGPGMPPQGMGMHPGMQPGMQQGAPGMPGGYPGPMPPQGGPATPGNYAAAGWPQPPPNANAQFGAQPQAAPASKKSMVIAAAIFVVIAVLGVGLYFAVRMLNTSREEAVGASADGGIAIAEANANSGAIPTAVATDPNAVPTAPTAAITAPPSTTPFNQGTAPTATAEPTPTTAPTVTATPTPTAAHPTPAPQTTGASHPTPTPVSTGASHPTPTPAPTNDGGFDQAAAQKSLRNMESVLVSCKKPDGPTGAGQVRVTFANDGSAMSAVIVGPPYEGTPVGDCAASRFKLARVPKFDGPPGVTNYTFHVPK